MTETNSPDPITQAATPELPPVNMEAAAVVPTDQPAPAEALASPAASNKAHLPATPELQAMEEDPEVKDVKTTLLESAELANRAASQALQAGADLQAATHHMIGGHVTQRKHGLIVLALFTTLMLIAMVLFGFMSARLQQRIAQADAMLLAVGKRVVTMNEAIELISDTGEALRDISNKQNAITSQQGKLDSRLDELMRATQSAMQAISQTSDPKNQEINKLLQAMDGRIQSNSNALKLLPSQLRSVPAASPNPTAIRREVEATLLRQQSKAAAPVIAPTTPVISPEKPIERLVQYPRVQSPATGTP